LSAIETEKGVLQIQTEFTSAPSKRIVTSQIFSGRVIRKKETPWPGIMEKEEDKLKAEEALVLQHKQEVEFAVSNWEELILPLFEELAKANLSAKQEELKDKLGDTAGVKKILLLDQDLNYLVIKNQDPSADSHQIEFVRQILDAGQLISSVSRVGRLVQFSADLKDGQHFLQQWGEKYLLVQTEKGCDLNRLKTSVQLVLAGV
jgi:hypothetical protein